MENEPVPQWTTEGALLPRTSPSKASNSSMTSFTMNLTSSPPPNAESRDVSRNGKQQHSLKVNLGTRVLPFVGIILLTTTVLTNLDSSSAVYEAAFQQVIVNKKEKVKVQRTAEEVITSNRSMKAVALMSNGTKPNKLPPLLLNIGRGTTGTRTFQKATCMLGLPTVHWGLLCVSPTPGFDDVSLHVQRGIRSQYELRAAFMEGALCLSGTKFCDMDAATWTNVVKIHVRGVVESGVVAVHDTPYTFMVPFITRLATEIRGVPPFLILSERDAEEWAPRRLDVHSRFFFLCKDFFKEGMNGDFTLVSDQDLEGFFDFFACMKRAEEKRDREQQEGGDDSKLSMGDVFIHVTKLQRPRIDKILTRAMKVYQDTMREKSDYAFMLFGHNKTESDIAEEIQKRLITLPKTTKEGFRNVPHYGSGNLIIHTEREFLLEQPTSRVET